MKYFYPQILMEINLSLGSSPYLNVVVNVTYVSI